MVDENQRRLSQTEAGEKKRRFIYLGWTLLEHKFRYYVLQRPIIGDTDFDLLEDEYEALAADLGLSPTAVDMVGFDFKRPSCRTAALKVLTGGKPRKGGNYILGSDGSLYKRANGKLTKLKTKE